MDAYDPAQPLSRTRRQQLWVRLAIRGAIFVGLLLLVFVFGPPLLGYVMPFLLAFLFTWLMEPLLRFFQRRLRMPRKAGAIVLILILVAALGGIITAIVLRLWGEISSLINNWDQVWNTFQSTYQQLAQDMQRWLSYLPQGVQDVILSLSDRLLAWLRDMAYNLVPGTTSAVRGLSSFVLAFVFFLLAWFFTAADYPNLRWHLHEKTPKSVRHVGRQAKTAFAAAFGGYVKAEVLVSLGVMVILMVGFLLLKQPYGILLAVLLGIMDFIPIIGSGTVMVPWSIILMAIGNWERGIAMLAVWGVICVFRRVIEPKFVGDQTGLHPLVALLAIYVGLKIGSLLGMILAPVLVLMVRNLWQAGMFHATVRDLTLAARDMAALLHREVVEHEAAQKAKAAASAEAPLPPSEGEESKEGETVQKKGTES